MTSCLRTVALVVGLCRIVKRHRLSFLNLALAVCWTRPQFTRNVRTDLIPAQSGSLLVSHIDDPPQEWAGFDLEIITRFLEETNPRSPSSLKTLGSVFFTTQALPSHIFNFSDTCNAYLYFLPVQFITFQVIIKGNFDDISVFFCSYHFWSNSDPLCLLG